MENKNRQIYILGALLGLLAVASAVATTFFLGKTNFLGTSTTFVRAAGLIEQFFTPDIAQQIPLYAKLKLAFDWQFMLVIGIGLGSLLSAVSSKTFKLEMIPPIWRQRFGSSILKRSILGFLGGVIFGLGWALTGFCPGTSVGALGEGRLHALPVILGMLAGAMLFAHTYPFLEESVLAWKDYGALSLTDVTGLPPLVIIAVCVLGGVCLLRFVDKKGL